MLIYQKSVVKLSHVCLLLLIFIQPLKSLGQFTVEQIKQADTLVLPGANQTVIYKIINQTDSLVAIRLRSDLKAPLKTILFPKNISLDSGESKNILITFSIAKNAAPLNYEYGFAFLLDTNSIYELKGKLEVKKVTHITLSTIILPEYARAGESVKVSYLVNNLGNGIETFSLKSNYANLLSPPDFVIGPDSVAQIDLLVKTSADLKLPYEYTFDLRLFDKEDIAVKSIQKSVKVYPIKVVKNDPFHRIPINISTSYLTRYKEGVNQVSTYQFEISGQGSLDSAGKHLIEYLYRGPDKQNVARIGRFSQKYIGYNGQVFGAYLGERSYTSNMLTDMFRYGTGVQVSYKPNPRMELKSYYMKPKFFNDIHSISSLMMTFEKNEKMQFETGLVLKEKQGGPKILLQSASMEYTNSASFKGKAELATAYGNTKPSMASHLMGEFNIHHLRFSTDGLYASKSYPGYFTNTLSINNQLSYSIKDWRLISGFNYSDANPKLDTVFGIAPVSKNLNGGFGYNFIKKKSVMFQYILRQKEDRFEPKQFSYKENVLRATFSSSQDKIGYALTAEYGKTINFLLPADNNTGKSMEAQFNFSYNSLKKTGFRLYTQFLRNIRFSNIPTNYLLYGTSMNIKLKKWLSMTLQYQNTFLLDELYQDRNIFDARINFKISERQSLSLYGNYAILFQSSEKRDFYGLASYNLQLKAPVKRIATFGTVEGKIENKASDHLEGILLFMAGQTAITNKEGKFLFNNVKPGIHSLLIEKGSIAYNEIADTIFPINVEVLPANKVIVNFAIVKTASVQGKVTLVEKVKVVQASGSLLKMPQLVIEISNGKQTFLTTTSSDGNFSYLGLRPGHWNIRIIPTSWTQDFTIEQSSREVEIEPGGQANLDFVIQPKVRIIKFKNANPVDIKK